MRRWFFQFSRQKVRVNVIFGPKQGQGQSAQSHQISNVKQIVNIPHVSFTIFETKSDSSNLLWPLLKANHVWSLLNQNVSNISSTPGKFASELPSSQKCLSLGHPSEESLVGVDFTKEENIRSLMMEAMRGFY